MNRPCWLLTVLLAASLLVMLGLSMAPPMNTPLVPKLCHTYSAARIAESRSRNRLSPLKADHPWSEKERTTVVGRQVVSRRSIREGLEVRGEIDFAAPL